jgi:hypothetical protein
MLESVLLKGKFRGHPAQAYWTRRPDGGWRITLTVGGKSNRIKASKGWKPCWTVSMKLMDEFLPGSGSVKSRRAKPKPEPEDDGMILKFKV